MDEDNDKRALTHKDTLLQYNMPELISRRSPKHDIPSSGPANISLADTHEADYIVDAMTKTASTEEILDVIFPPRQWEENGRLWRQTVSPHPVTTDCIPQLGERLDKCLQEQQAKEDGIDAVRAKLFDQFFDEVIRIETVICGERGLLLGRIRDDLKNTKAAYRKLYESCIGYAMRKSLMAEKQNRKEAQHLAELEESNSELRREIEVAKEKTSKLQKEFHEQRETEMKNHAEALVSLREINEQMKGQLRTLLKPKVQK